MQGVGLSFYIFVVQPVTSLTGEMLVTLCYHCSDRIWLIHCSLMNEKPRLNDIPEVGLQNSTEPNLWEVGQRIEQNRL